MKKLFFTYGKTGRITRHRLLSSALRIAEAQALAGRDAYVDQFNGRFTRTVKFFPKRVPRKKIRKMIRDKRKRIKK